MRFLFALVAVLAVALGAGFVNAQATNPDFVSTTFTVANTGQTSWVPTKGLSTCVIVATGGATFSTTVVGASDNPPSTGTTVTTIGSNGVISANGSYGGSIATLAQTGIALNTTSISSGPETMTVTCSNAVAGGGSAGSGSGGSVTASGTFNATGATAFLGLSGQSSCVVVLGGTGTGLSITVQGASDSPPTGANAVTVTTIGASGVITVNGAYGGGVANLALTGIRLNVGTISGGTETYQITCSGAVPVASISAMVAVSPVPLPVVVPTASPFQAPVALIVCPTSGPTVLNSATICQMDSNGRLLVSTPAPAPTVSPGLLVGVTLTCPTSTSTISGNNVCITDASGNVLVAPAPWTELATASPTSTPLAVKASAGTLGGARMWNGTGGTLFIGFYDAAVASVTLGTTAPKNLLACPTLTYCFLPLPAGGAVYGTAITYMCGSALTGGVPTTGCGSATTTQITIDYRYASRAACRSAPEHLRAGPTLERLRLRQRVC